MPCSPTASMVEAPHDPLYLSQDGSPVGGWAAPTCSKDGQREVGDGFPGVGLALGPTLPRPQDGQGPSMAVAPQQLPVLVAEDIQGGLETGRIPGLDHLLHQLQGQESHQFLPVLYFQTIPLPCSLQGTAHKGVVH